MPDWKQKRGWLNRTLEKVEDIPDQVLYGSRPVSDSAKRELYEQGLPGRATVLKAPPASRISTVQRNVAKFRVRVELEGREPYEATTLHSFGEYDHERLREGALVECRVDRDDDQKVLLIVPEPGEVPVTVVDSAQILTEGKRGRATVTESAPLGQTMPGTNDPAYLLNIEIRADGEPEPWRAQIGQRVPSGAEEMVAPGRELTVAYLVVDSGDSVAVDWPASSEGRLS